MSVGSKGLTFCCLLSSALSPRVTARPHDNDVASSFEQRKQWAEELMNPSKNPRDQRQDSGLDFDGVACAIDFVEIDEGRWAIRFVWGIPIGL